MNNTKRYSFIDVETTGGNKEGNKIIEIAIINVDNEMIVEKWSTLINPERSIPWSITKLTGIDETMIKDAPYFYQVAKKIIELTQDRIFVAHNVFFDYRFLQREFSELGFTYRRQTLCTVRLSRLTFPGLASYSLTSLCAHFKLSRENAHRALDDVLATVELFFKIPREQLESVQQNTALPASLMEDALEQLPEKTGTYFFYSEKGALLYIGKAKNIKRRVRSHFQKKILTKRDKELRELVHRIDYKLWGSELIASIMELTEIKTLKPHFNRASRKTKFPYFLTYKENTELGEEIGITKIKNDMSIPFGSKKLALNYKKLIYQNCFGLDTDSLQFKTQLTLFKNSLGYEKYSALIKKHLLKYQVRLEDQTIILPGRAKNETAVLVIEDKRLKEVQFIDQDENITTFNITSFPDIERMVMLYLSNH